MYLFDYITNDCEVIERPGIKALDNILGRKFLIPNTNSFVRLVDYMGSEDSILNFARVSYASNKNATKSIKENIGLIRYLLRHRHTSPFEACELVFHLSMPIFVERQFVRHRTASLNQISGRYSELPDTMYSYAPEEWRLQSTDNKQGSEGFAPIEVGKELSKIQEELQKHTRRAYEDRLEKGIAKEVARIDLPVSQYTEMYWKCDLHNLLHFLSLRTDSHAQQEIRDLANLILGITELGFPNTVNAWRDYRVDSITLTACDRKALELALTGIPNEELRDKFPIKREYDEYLQKFDQLIS